MKLLFIKMDIVNINEEARANYEAVLDLPQNKDASVNEKFPFIKIKRNAVTVLLMKKGRVRICGKSIDRQTIIKEVEEMFNIIIGPRLVSNVIVRYDVKKTFHFTDFDALQCFQCYLERFPAGYLKMPEHIQVYTNGVLICTGQKSFDKAKDALLRAEKLLLSWTINK